ncbi:glycosyltransferase family 4 protein [Lutibacter sp.]|uniref:glycosyltransferase n=1 Tax=Lutibacter sp. TaxID=1925666 RepID=UPI00273592B5|nr:glycosyltransferase family 4 protein [Lutibacter sp.]MDP3313370.1 glycosyltransferase family 4 protein [Lutibacter sp.]
MNKLLVIGMIWPEPNTTAAGTRMLQLLKLFLSNNYEIIFASTSTKGKNSFPLESLGIITINIKLNDASFNDFIKKLEPKIVLFDRYIAEEQFGWRVIENCPNTFRILDTEDLHFLRKAIETAVKKNEKVNLSVIGNSIALRELASIYRCDLTLIISKVEFKILHKHFDIKESQLLYLPFLIHPISLDNIKLYPSFFERANFMSIGNFKHEPNADAVLHLKKTIWPLIRNQLPNVELHIYGAYCSQKFTQLTNKKDGFIVKGFAESSLKVFENSKVLLAPLRFGAGLKGKLINSMEFGTPNVTTKIGSEGMHKKLPWNGFIKNDITEFATAAVELYSNQQIWEESQKKGIEIINKCYSQIEFEQQFISTIAKISNNLMKHRTKNIIGAILNHHTLQSTKYLSKWIEEKNN